MKGKTAKKSAADKTRLAGEEITIEAVRPGLHEKAEGINSDTVWRISGKDSAERRLGISLGRIFGGSDNYVKLPAEDLGLPQEAIQRIAESSLPDETALFLSTRLCNARVDSVLAVRYGKQWREVYRWRPSWEELGISRLHFCGF